MFIETFNYDGQGASVVDKKTRKDSSGNTVVRITLDNGVIFVYTETGSGFKRLDTNFDLVKQSNGYYKSDLSSLKQDFHDYF